VVLWVDRHDIHWLVDLLIHDARRRLIPGDDKMLINGYLTAPVRPVFFIFIF